MTHLPTDRVEVPIGLVAQLSYYQESKNSNANERNQVNILLSAARKTISQMLMEDVQVTTSPSNSFPSDFSFLLSYVNSMPMFSMEAMKVNLFSAIRSSPLQI